MIAAHDPVAVVGLSVVVCGFFVPIVNAPLMGMLTTRPPVALRAKVLTAVMTASGLGAPLGRLAVGPIFQRYGNSGVWIALAGGLSLGALLFVAVVFRRSPGDAPDVVGVSTVADPEAHPGCEGARAQLGA